MGLSIIKCFSILVSSGNGKKCSSLRGALKEYLVAPDEQTGLSRIFIHKNCKRDPIYTKDYNRVAKELSDIIYPLIKNIPDHFYGPDRSAYKNDRN